MGDVSSLCSIYIYLSGDYGAPSFLVWHYQIREKTGENILVIARQDLNLAAQSAKRSAKVPVGRFLSAPLALENPDPELFRLALESAADEELAEMLKGEKLLECSDYPCAFVGSLRNGDRFDYLLRFPQNW